MNVVRIAGAIALTLYQLHVLIVQDTKLDEVEDLFGRPALGDRVGLRDHERSLSSPIFRAEVPAAPSAPHGAAPRPRHVDDPRR